MESRDCKWLKTKDDGVLLFKNISIVKESDKADDSKNEYEHTEENCVLNFDSLDSRFLPGQKYFHSEMGVFCTISDRILDENDKLKEIKVRLESLDSEAVIPATEPELSTLSDTLDINIRVVQKTGTKLTLKGQYSLFDNMTGNLKEIFSSLGFNSGNFKVFHNDTLLEKNAEIDKIYEHGKELYFMAFESMGKPRKWCRFPRAYEYGTWSNSGSCTDSICFIPSKNVTIAGFQTYAAKDEPEYEMKYRLKINDVEKELSPVAKYSNWEETYFKTIMFNDTYDVPANGRITITVWISKSFSSSSCVYTYYGTDGYSYATVVNEQMGLFTVDSGGDSSNGTSTSSGQIPSILYFSD